MAIYKHCSFEELAKHGRVRGKQRYRRKRCGLHFAEGGRAAAGKAMAIVLYSLAKALFGVLGKVFGVSRRRTVVVERQQQCATDHPERMSRRIQPVSKREFMVNASIKCWAVLTDAMTFLEYPREYMYLYMHSLKSIMAATYCFLKKSAGSRSRQVPESPAGRGGL